MKLSAFQFHNLKEALPEVIAQLNDGVRTEQLAAAVPAQVYKKVHGQSLLLKVKYNVKLTEAEKVAVVYAIELGLFEAMTEEISITSGAIMMELHKQLPNGT